MIVFVWLVGLCFWLDLLFPPCLAVYALLRWQGRWRTLAVAPLAVIVPAAISFLIWNPGRSHGTSPWVFAYTVLALAVCAYSAGVLLMYTRSKCEDS